MNGKTNRNSSQQRKVLISGASISGPALAYWLNRYGFEVTVVEKADAVRGGGYPIDIRATALEVVERMGLLPQLTAAHVDSRRLTFLDADGELIAALRPEDLTGGVEGRDLEVPRGDLTKALYGTVRDEVEFLFDDSIDTLDDHDKGVDIVFRSGVRRTFDLVIGADGLHSNTRSLAFGPEEQYHRYLGSCFAGFTMRNDFGLAHEGVVWNEPGRAAALYAVKEGEQLYGLLTFARAEAPLHAFRDPKAQRDLVAETFPEQKWEVPRLVAAMRTADDLFFDVVSQIHMPSWSTGRVVLAGDAAHATSFVSGQGSSVALIGAYILAGELAATTDHSAAFRAYEDTARDFVERNQALAGNGSTGLTPRTPEDLARRNEALRTGSFGSGEGRSDVYGSLKLPDYEIAR